MKYVWALIFFIACLLLFYLHNQVNGNVVAPEIRANTDNSQMPSSPTWPHLTLLTEHSPPGEYLDENGHVAGKTVELLHILSQRLGEKVNIELLPWARALELAKNGSNMALFETIQSDERKNWFHWVGPLKIYDISLYARADKISGALEPSAISPKLIACATRGSSYVEMLENLGFQTGINLVQTITDDNCARLMIQGKVDVAPCNERSLEELARAIAPDTQLIPVMPLKQMTLYLAFSHDVDRQRVALWQQALETSYRDGTMRELYSGTYNEKLIQRLEAFAANAAP